MFALDVLNGKKLMLTEKELSFLAGTMGFSRLSGLHPSSVPDQGEEWMNGLKQVGVSLLQKGYISGNELEKLLASSPSSDSESVFATAYTCGCCLRCSFPANEQEPVIQTHYYLNKDGIFEIKPAAGMSGQYEMERAGALEQADELVLQPLQLNCYPAAEMPALSFSRQWFDEHVHLRDLLYLPEMTTELFAMTGDEEGAGLFAGVIADNRLYAELQFACWTEEGWSRQHAVLLADDNTNWIVRQLNRQESDWVIAVPLDREHFHTILLDWMEQSTNR
ncbi:hypothetical protein ACE3MZ_10045 [Paenibacillus sp. WLX1005]|uniref:hypothetical protein n=1 Tax=Paenibacillus sp. WLX1005 TaxID=3243766 RepID=UPI0039845978